MTRTNRADGAQRLPSTTERECIHHVEIKQEDPLQLAQETGPMATGSPSSNTGALDDLRWVTSSETGVAFDRWFHTISARLSTLEKAFSSQAITIALLTEEKDQLKTANARNESSIAQLRKELQNSQRVHTTEKSSGKADAAKTLQQASNDTLTPRITTLQNTSRKALTTEHRQAKRSSGQIPRNNLGCKRLRQSPATPSSDDETSQTITSDIPSPRASSSPAPHSFEAVPSASSDAWAEEFNLVPAKKYQPRSNISASIPNSDSQSFKFAVIASMEQLKQFDDDLGQADGIYRQTVFNWLRSSITPCTNFRLPMHEAIDLLFCRKFFAKLSCSGNGISRFKDIPFRAYINVIELFVDVAKSNGANPTRKQITHYIQVKLRHARMRDQLKATNARNESSTPQLRKELQMVQNSQRALTTEKSSDKTDPAKQLQQASNDTLTPRIKTLANTSEKAVPSASSDALAEEFYLVPVNEYQSPLNISNSDTQTFSFTLIASVEQLKQFEADLGQADGIYRQTVFNWLRSSVTPCEYFQTPIHETIDLLFCRNFFAKLSWSGTGISRLLETPFKAYTNIVGLFVDIAKSNGANPTMKEIVGYMQIKLRHARKRAGVKMLRKSTTHIHTKKK